jgi:rubrerythrin
MAENISEIPGRELFLDLASMEDEHQKVFASMRTHLSDKEREPAVFDPEGEAALYLQALADLRVFDQDGEEDFILSDELSEEEKMKKVFRAAINREKESIVFYLGMKELVPKSLGKDKIDAIISEEMKHIRLLSSEPPRGKPRGISKGAVGDCIPFTPAPHSSPP